jgi:hypothetical protein
VTQQPNPHKPTITDEASGYVFPNTRYQDWNEGHASRDGEVEMLRGALTRISEACQRNGEDINHQWVISVAKGALRDPQ